MQLGGWQMTPIREEATGRASRASLRRRKHVTSGASLAEAFGEETRGQPHLFGLYV